MESVSSLFGILEIEILVTDVIPVKAVTVTDVKRRHDIKDKNLKRNDLLINKDVDVDKNNAFLRLSFMIQ